MEFSIEDCIWHSRSARGTYQLSDKDAEKLVRVNMRHEALHGRVSPVLALQLLQWFKEEGEPPAAFARPMVDVVLGTDASWEKQHKRLSGPKLGPLDIWHKHVSLARHMLENARLATRDEKATETRMQEAAAAGMVASILFPDQPHKVQEAAGERLMRPVMERVRQRRQTGDWIIFEQTVAGPHFLCLYPHLDKDDPREDALASLVAFIRAHWMSRSALRGT